MLTSKMHTVLAACVVTTCLNSQLHAQARFDAGPLVKELSTPLTHNAALATLRQIPEESLASIVEAADNDETPAAVKREITAELPAIYARLRTARKQLLAAEETNFVKLLLNDYQKFGSKNAQWDAKVTAAFTAMQIGQPSEANFKAAIDAGCNDPLVLYYYGKSALRSSSLSPEQGLQFLDRAAQTMATNHYPAVRVFFANYRFLTYSLSTENPPDTLSKRHEAAFNLALSTFEESTKGMITSRTANEEAAVGLYNVAVQLYGPAKREIAYFLVVSHISNALPQGAIQYVISSRYYIDWAWDARGAGTAGTVTEEGWKLFGERIKEAHTAAEKGWRVDPLESRCPEAMITICMAESSSRNDMEKWYRRAILANPDSIEARDAKYNYLLPQWHGSVAEVRAFGLQCLQEGTVDNRIPCILLDIHTTLSQSAEDPDAYFARPDVWADVQHVYAKMLADKSRVQKDPATVLFDRTRYLKFAAQGKHWETVQSLITQYGTEFNMEELGGKARYTFLKDQVAKNMPTAPR